MKRKLAFIMAAIMLVTTPASVLASESMDVSVVSEDTISEDDSVEAYVEETPAEEDYAEEVTDIPEASYEASGEAEAGAEDYDVIIEDGGLTEDSSADAAETTEYGDDDFIVAIEEVPTTYSEVTDLEDDNIVASGECGDNLTWVLDVAGTLTISGTGAMDDCINGSPWSDYLELITSVEIENGVTSIGTDAFQKCSSLKSVLIPDGVTEISGSAFYQCTSLEKVNIPDGVTIIVGSAFEGCSSLKDVTLPESLTWIGDESFEYCSSLTSINIPKNVTYIGYWAFADCGSLDVYYGGSESDWKLISIKDESFEDTKVVIYYAEEDPEPIDISTCTVTLSPTSYTYDGSAKKPSVTVKDGSTTLKSGTDYTVSYSNNTNAGTATVTVTGKGNYTGTVTKNFTINKASQTLTAKASSSSIVKGKTATITASGKGTISYSSNKKSVATVSSKGKITAKAIGTAKITVKAAGNSNYKSATKTLTIKVIPKATTLSSAKSSSSKKLTVKWKKVSGVSGYQIQYSTSKTFKSGNKTAKVSGASKVSKTISKLKKGKTYYVRVRTYKKVSGTTYYSSWTSKKKVKVK